MKKTIITTTILAENSPQALPLGAACIASALKANKFLTEKCNILLCDFNANSSADFVADNLCKHNPFAICFSVYVWNRLIITKAINLIRSKFSNIIIVGGGPEITAISSIKDYDKEFCNLFDYLSVGAGEASVPELFENLLQNANVVNKTLRGVFVPYKTPNYENLPSPYLDGTLNIEKYGGVLWELARGCPFSCSYCYESKGDKKIIHFPIERLEEELDFFESKKVPQVFVLDPTYNSDKNRALSILYFIAKKAPCIHFHFEARAELLDKALCRAFASINSSIQIGLQSCDKNVLDLVNRKFNSHEFIERINVLNSTSAIFGFDLIYGLPGDSLSGYKKSIDYALALLPNHLELFKLSVLPGTMLYDNAVNQISFEYCFDFMKTAPYHVLSSKKFPKNDLQKAENLSKATNIFYSKGRAVTWFMSFVKIVNNKPSEVLYKFEKYLDNKTPSWKKDYELFESDTDSSCEEKINIFFSHKNIEKMQLDFIACLFENKKKCVYSILANIIKIYGAFSRASIEKETEIIKLDYDPDFLLSEYVDNLLLYANEIKKSPCKVKVFPFHGDVDYSIIN